MSTYLKELKEKTDAKTLQNKAEVNDLEGNMQISPVNIDNEGDYWKS